MSENCGGLVINPEELARIRAACQRRAAELAASQASAATVTEAERFAGASPKFFERERERD
jgi:hypothetical protein